MMHFLYNVSEEIKKAGELYSRYGREIPGDPEFADLFDMYKKSVSDSWQLMNDLGVTDICSACGLQRPGGCCYFGIETWYPGTFLFMNLLLGVEIPEKRVFENSCLFAGNNGCRLRARFKTCIYHLCSKIKDSLDESDFRLLRSVNNHEIELGCRIEAYIKAWIQKNDPDNYGPGID